MIRYGMKHKLAAQAERERLIAQWQAYPRAVQMCLSTLLQEYGLRAARLATEAVEARRQVSPPETPRGGLHSEFSA